ncbi:MAG TPA: hypothetical protein VME66_10750 [Candidatus Acidoferrales bacterium]|nr:hypothetical protein [Candidatus Acidoferrales bacterium]
MLRLLSWIADDQGRFLAVSQTLLFGFAALIVAGTASRRLGAALSTWRGKLLFMAFALLVIVGGRWPTFFVRDPLNQDEAQALAQAITALHNPIPWLEFDGNTCGPLNTYVLTLPALFGQHLTFLSTRIITILLEFGATVALYFCAELTFDSGVARIAVAAPVAFFTLCVTDDLMHYTGAHLSIFLGMLTLLCICVAYRRRFRGASMFWVGLVAGMMPFAKLQSVPLAGATVAVALVSLATTPDLDLSVRLRGAARLLIGLLTAPAILLGAATLGGSIYDFYVSYILSSLAYILWEYRPITFVTATPGFGPFFDGLVALCALAALLLVTRWRRITPAARNAYVAALIVLGGAIWTIFAPKRGSISYLPFGVMPASVAGAAAVGLIATWFGAAGDARLRRTALAVAFVVLCLGTNAAFTRPPNPHLDALDDYLNGPPDPVTAMVQHYITPGQRLAVWGWRPQYVVESDTLLGTRDSITAYQFGPSLNPYLDYFRQRYITDFERNKPAGFLDSGPDSFDFSGKGQFGHEIFPQLDALIRRDYHLVASVNFFRLYLRNDLASLEPQSVSSTRRLPL